MTRIPAFRAASRTRGGRRDRLAQQRHIVAERLAKSARIDEVALHVDDDERNMFGLENKLVGFSAYTRHLLLPGSAALCGVLSGEILSPTSELGDVASPFGRVRLAQKALHAHTILELDGADAKRCRYSRDKAAEHGQRHFPNLDLDCGANFGADETGPIRRPARQREQPIV